MSSWEDTVMRDKGILSALAGLAQHHDPAYRQFAAQCLLYGAGEQYKAIAQVQAKSSFKAGQRSRDAEWNKWKDRYIPEVIRNSQRKVVEWMETFEQNQYYIFVKQESSQAFKKERGL